jgi:hypothetical protein
LRHIEKEQQKGMTTESFMDEVKTMRPSSPWPLAAFSSGDVTAMIYQHRQ